MLAYFQNLPTLIPAFFFMLHLNIDYDFGCLKHNQIYRNFLQNLLKLIAQIEAFFISEILLHLGSFNWKTLAWKK